MKTKQVKHFTKTLNFTITSVKSAENKTDDCIIEGYANTVDKDRVGDVVLPAAFEKTLPTYLKNPVLLFNHDWDDVAGKVLKTEITDKGLFVRARVSDTRGDIKTLVREGCVSTFSIGYNEIDADYDESTKTKFIKELELLEISIVTIPANTEAMFTTIDSAKEEEPAKEQAAPQKSLEKFIAEVKEVAGDIDEKLLTDIGEYYAKSKGEVMTKEQLIEALRAKSAPAVTQATEDKKEEPAAQAPEAPAEESQEMDAMAAVVARLDAMAEALAQLLELAKKPAEAEAPKQEEKPAAEAPAEEAKTEEQPTKEEEKAVEEVACEKCSEGKMEAQEDGSLKCKACGFEQKQAANEDQALELLSDSDIEALLGEISALES